MNNTRIFRYFCFVFVMLTISLVSVSAASTKHCTNLNQYPETYGGGSWPKDLGPYYLGEGSTVWLRVGGYVPIVTIYVPETFTFVTINTPVEPTPQTFFYNIPADGWYTFHVSPHDFDPGTTVHIGCKG